MKKPLRVFFKGEQGQDAGGPRREFASLLVEELARCQYLEGPPSSRCFAHDTSALQRGVYYNIGVLVAITLLQSGPGLPILSRPVADYVVFGEVQEISIDDVPDLSTKAVLEEVCLMYYLCYSDVQFIKPWIKGGGTILCIVSCLTIATLHCTVQQE